ncbi:lipoprotein [Mycoplasma feriruminatoris]|uniref:hypothetical protein n=1 Tax=Mycoplasma feriruminatoris TaxID=1179777 RepID=UPI0024200775|nr:hypothetical protein [Mycoplasma feriruminatoris]WFQ91051.1 lipoprotein [Mycoplasma feriruminatoris]
MKKILTIMNSFLVLCSSLVIVSCKKSNATMIKDLKDNSDNKKHSHDSDVSNKMFDNSNDNSNKDSKKPKPFNESQNETISKKEKDEKTNKFISEIKSKINDAIVKNDKEEIIKIVDSIFAKHTQLMANSKLSKISYQFNEKIKKWLNNFDIDSISTDFLTFFNENIDSKYVKKNIDKYKNIIRGQNKNTVISELQELFNQTLSEELEQESTKNKTEINNLIVQEKYVQAKEIVFKLIEEIAKLEKYQLNKGK